MKQRSFEAMALGGALQRYSETRPNQALHLRPAARYSASASSSKRAGFVTACRSSSLGPPSHVFPRDTFGLATQHASRASFDFGAPRPPSMSSFAIVLVIETRV